MSKRGGSSNPISLFSFQDIITSVTGIMILVTLMMTLELVQRKVGSPIAKTAKATANIQPSIEEMQQRISELKQQLNASQQAMQSAAMVDAKTADSKTEDAKQTAEAIQRKIDGLKPERDQTEKDHREAKNKEKEIEDKKKAIEKIKEQIAKSREELGKIKKSNRMIFNPEAGTSKIAWLIDLSGSSILVAKIGESTPPKRFGDGDFDLRLSKLTDWVTTRDPNQEYFVLLVRPSAVDLYHKVQDLFTSYGFDIGYDLISESQEIMDPMTGAGGPMSRKSDADLGSLELLLDTICNTFGGVIFIAILVVVLLQMTGKDTPTEVDEKSQADLIAAEDKRQETAAELERLKNAAQQQQKISGSFFDPKAAEAAARLAAAQARVDGLVHEHSEIAGAIATGRAEVNNINKETKQLDDAKNVSQQELAVLEAAIAKEVATRSKTAKLPKVRETTKKQMGMMIRSGRAHFVYKSQGNGYVYDEGDCELQVGPTGSQMVPRAGRGLVIDPSIGPKLEARLGDFKQDEHFMSIFVWSDSFEQFAIVRDVLVHQGFEYQLVPLPTKQNGLPIVNAPFQGKVQ